MICNPFIVDVMTVPDDIQEELIELQNDTSCKDNFTGGNLEEFWCKKALAYPKIRNMAVRLLTLFSTTYLCEQGFSNVLAIKTKQRSKLVNPEFDLRLALVKNITPRIDMMVKKMQAQPSH
uniref:SCAN domain-containing protein 3 n=1 Tax=Cacopsylla melanoneura TaxID=428564 RepID=A0A8D9EX81_9HEMI